MKKVLFLPFAAALAFAGCSDDPTAEGGENGQKTDDGTRYLAVTISTPSTGSSLYAADHVGENEFYPGEYAEQFAPSGLFLLFDTNGSQVGTPQLVHLNPWADANSNTPQVERISSAVLILGSETEGVKKVEPNRVVCILNATEDMATALKGRSLSDIKKTIADYSFVGRPVSPDENPDAARGSLIMTNSVYRNTDGGEEFAVNISSHIATTPETAKLNPVDIYVERVVAKVRVEAIVDDAAHVNNTNINLKRAGVVEKNVEIKPVLKAVTLANIADKSYLFKNITGLDNRSYPDWTTWNDPVNKRCYWAISPSTTTAEGTDTEPLGFKNLSWNNIKDRIDVRTRYYLQENTSNTPTCVLLTAQLHEVKNGIVADEPITLCKLAGMYYTPADGLTLMATYVQNAGWRYLEADGKTYSAIRPEDLRWMTKEESQTASDIVALQLKGWEAVARFAKTESELAGRTLVKERLDGAAKVYDVKSIDDLNAAMAQKQYRALMWTDGCTYYFVDIEHFGFINETITSGSGETATTETKKVYLKGIVRNHAYVLTLNSVSNLGVPVFDPDEEIIPEKPSDDSFYAAARINVLKWKLVGQTVNFE